MDLKAYYRLISSEGKPKKYLLGKCFKNHQHVSLLLVPLFVSAVRRAEELAVAMDCRLYRSGAARTRYRELRMARADWAALGVSIAFTLGMFV